MSEKSTERVYRRWSILTLSSTVAVLAVLAAFTAYIDPLFHYHGPLEQFEYPLNSDDRYQNSGILRNFEYNGLIIGNSMSQAFKTSEAEALFRVPFVKTPFPSANFQEINDNLEVAYAAGKEIQYVIRSLDFNYRRICKVYSSQDEYRAELDMEFPSYLYNSSLIDDVNYVLNKSIFLDRTLWVINFTRSGSQSTTFDNYGVVDKSGSPRSFNYGAKFVFRHYTLGEPYNSAPMSDEMRQTIIRNIRQNVTDLADAHPETTFYLFFPPYSICYWDLQQNAGAVDLHIDVAQVVIEELLKHSNINFYSFFTNYDLICDLNNYWDYGHYGEWVNSWILEQMHSGNYLLTEDNYLEHLDAMREFYNSYDYASLHN